ncbi:MAG: site-specific DNA-methyltransferase, partial [bacterium]|nr:site-specific DNA-methyltransferase [bacterium]
MHKYWAKKPHNVVRAFILQYTRPGEVVLDPFCG